MHTRLVSTSSTSTACREYSIRADGARRCPVLISTTTAISSLHRPERDARQDAAERGEATTSRPIPQGRLFKNDPSTSSGQVHRTSPTLRRRAGSTSRANGMGVATGRLQTTTAASICTSRSSDRNQLYGTTATGTFTTSRTRAGPTMTAGACPPFLRLRSRWLARSVRRALSRVQVDRKQNH